MQKKDKDWQSVESDGHYRPSTYLNPSRMASIGYQIKLLSKHFSGASVLEIGVGNGLTSQLLKQEGHPVTTFDIDGRLNPDIEGSITENDLGDAFIDTVLCCQVLEHLPWEQVSIALSEIHRIVKLGAVISVPSVTRVMNIQYMSSKRTSTRQYRMPLFKSTGQPIRVKGDFHYWEIGANKSKSEFDSLIQVADFRIVDSFRPIENPYHQFYVLSKG